MTLFDLPLYSKAIIKKINWGEDIIHNIHSLGIIEEGMIEYVKSTPFRDPKVYLCLGTEIAIRNDMARKIEVEVI